MALAVLLAVMYVVPVPLWVARGLRGLQRRRQLELPPVRDVAVEHLPPGLATLVRQTRAARTIVRATRHAAKAYRDSLSFVSLFFAPRDVPSRRDGQVSDVREAYEHAVVAATSTLHEWLGQLERLGATDRAVLDDLGVAPYSIRGLLEGGAFPRSRAMIGRLRFSGQPEVDDLAKGLASVERELAGLELALLEYRGIPYR